MPIDDIDPSDEEVEREAIELEAVIVEGEDNNKECECAAHLSEETAAYRAETERLDKLFQFISSYVATPTAAFPPSEFPPGGDIVWTEDRLPENIRKARNRLIMRAMIEAESIMNGS